MKESMGQIIRRLRKERGLTQDELAEILGVTFQAVSKWENDSGMPDISQVVPLATVFNVSTDVLFGIYGTDNAVWMRLTAKELTDLAEDFGSYAGTAASEYRITLCTEQEAFAYVFPETELPIDEDTFSADMTPIPINENEKE